MSEVSIGTDAEEEARLHKKGAATSTSRLAISRRESISLWMTPTCYVTRGMNHIINSPIMGSEVGEQRVRRRMYSNHEGVRGGVKRVAQMRKCWIRGYWVLTQASIPQSHLELLVDP
jgi:hypothetical protein